MILINPTIGAIGTGYSCQVPAYNPKDIINWIKLWLEGDDNIDLIPWYRGFLGKIANEDGKITTYGIFTELKKDTYKITEIPIGKLQYTISKYKSILEDLRETSFIKTIRDNSTEEIKSFV